MEEHEHRVRDVPLPDGRHLRVRVWPGSGRPLVLLHGLLDDSIGWGRLAADTRRPAIAIDLPGFGGSDLPKRPRISAYADDVAAALGRMRLDGCTVVGHSLGGAVATAVAERSPLVGGLALLAPAGFGSIRLAEALSLPGVVHVAQAALPFALVSPLHVAAAYTTFVAHRRLPSRDLMARLRRRAFRSASGVRAATEEIAAAGRSPRGFQHRRVEFDGPVAALWGDRDALVPLEHIAALRRALPQAHVEVWEEMGHHPQRERPHDLIGFVEAHALRCRPGGPQRTPDPCAVPARGARSAAGLGAAEAA
jgi:pimeloyl-ACP methyl ester carboxylesterase